MLVHACSFGYRKPNMHTNVFWREADCCWRELSPHDSTSGKWGVRRRTPQIESAASEPSRCCVKLLLALGVYVRQRCCSRFMWLMKPGITHLARKWREWILTFEVGRCLFYSPSCHRWTIDWLMQRLCGRCLTRLPGSLAPRKVPSVCKINQ